MSTNLKLHTTLSILEQCHSVPSLYQEHGHPPGACQSAESWAPTPDPLHPQEEWVSSPGDSDTCFKAVTGRAGEVCAENTPARALPRSPGGLGGGRGL